MRKGEQSKPSKQSKHADSIGKHKQTYIKSESERNRKKVRKQEGGRERDRERTRGKPSNES